MFKYNIGNATHVGQVRKANEDYFGNFQTPNGHVFVVCDGMGGHVGGAKASRLAVESIKSFLSSNEFSDPKIAIHHSIVNANTSIIKFAEQNPELKGMGATCVMMLISKKGIFIGHVGDSRIYHYTDSKLMRLTKDHSFVQALVDMGEISESEAERHPRKNEISNALGLPNMKPPTIKKESIFAHKNDIILLCTDGLTGIVNDKGIAQVLGTNKSIQAKSDILIESANHGGGNDNITVQQIEFTDVPAINPSSLPPKRLFKNLIAISIIALLLVIGGVLAVKYFGLKLNPSNQITTIEQTADSLSVENSPRSEVHTSKGNVTDQGNDVPPDSDKPKVPVELKDSIQDTAKQESTHKTSLVNPGAKETNTHRVLKLKSFELKITDYKDTTIHLKQIIAKSAFEVIDTVSLRYRALGKKNLVELIYNDELKTIRIVPDIAKNGKSSFEVWLISQKDMSPISDTVRMTIKTIPMVDLKEFTVLLNKNGKKKIAVDSLISINRIIGYNKDSLSIKIHEEPDWVSVESDSIFINAPKNPNYSFKYEILNGKTSIGLKPFHIKFATN